MCSIKSGKIFGFRRGHGRAERGFALIASLLALWILAALGILVFTVTTQDVRISSKTVGEKKAFLAAESGVSWLAQNFNPATITSGPPYNTPQSIGPSASDPNSQFTVTPPAAPTSGPSTLPAPGYEIGGGEVWGQTRWVSTVTGQNTNYRTNIQIQVGLGYGPVDITTLYR